MADTMPGSPNFDRSRVPGNDEAGCPVGKRDQFFRHESPVSSKPAKVDLKATFMSVQTAEKFCLRSAMT